MSPLPAGDGGKALSVMGMRQNRKTGLWDSKGGCGAARAKVIKKKRKRKKKKEKKIAEGRRKESLLELAPGQAVPFIAAGTIGPVPARGRC